MDTDGIDDSSAVTLMGADSNPHTKPVTALLTYQARPAELSPLSPFVFSMLFKKEKAQAHVQQLCPLDAGTHYHVDNVM
jgi:hypothetical protein